MFISLSSSVVRRLGLEMINVYHIKFEVSMFAIYEDEKALQKGFG